MKHNIARNSNKRNYKIVGTAIRVNGRVVGQVIGTEYVKDIHNSGILTSLEAIANDVQALVDAEQAGATCCVFTNLDTGIIYKASIAKIYERGRRINYRGDQISLGLMHWNQSVDPDFRISSQAHEDTEYVTPEPKPLKYKSHATKGVVFNGVNVKQLELFSGRRR